MGVVKKLFGGGDSPAPPVAAPAPPSPDNTNVAANTSASTAAAAVPGPGRAANISAGDDPSLSASSDDPYSVKKKLLGA